MAPGQDPVTELMEAFSTAVRAEARVEMCASELKEAREKTAATARNNLEQALRRFIAFSVSGSAATLAPPAPYATTTARRSSESTRMLAVTPCSCCNVYPNADGRIEHLAGCARMDTR